MLSVLILITLIILFCYTFHKWAIKNYDYFQRRGVKSVKPTYLLGNTGALFLLNKYRISDFLSMIYNKHPNERIIGIFEFRTPLYFLRDPSMIKQIGVKHFDYFEDRRSFIDEKVDKLFGSSLVMLKGEKWRQMRATLSPAFTGSKMRQMFELIADCSQEIVACLQKQVKNGEKINWEMKDFFSKYANDVIATCAFGVKVNSIENPHNEFYEAGKKMANFNNFRTSVKLGVLISCRWLAKLLGLTLISPAIASKFKSMILDTMSYRSENQIFRPDVINMLMQVRKSQAESTTTISADEKIDETADGFATVEESDVGKTIVRRQWTDDELVAQCFLFFLGGFDAPSTMMMYVVYELTVNRDIQDRLYDEFVECRKKCGSKRIDYDLLQKLTYLDQVVSETFRKWPVSPLFDRICVKDIEIQDGNNKFTIEKNSAVWFPIYALHHDPKYFPKPEKFDPERFNDENKDQILSGTYIPFGVGPRNCIGSRFALMEVKAIIYFLLLEFSFEPNERTQIPLKLKKLPFSLLPEKGVEITFKPRK